jgi:hypothetical protein
MVNDHVQVAEIGIALDKLSRSYAFNFLTDSDSDSDSAPERAMLASVLSGSADKYTYNWFRHELMEARLSIIGMVRPRRCHHLRATGNILENLSSLR